MEPWGRANHHQKNVDRHRLNLLRIAEAKLRHGGLGGRISMPFSSSFGSESSFEIPADSHSSISAFKNDSTHHLMNSSSNSNNSSSSNNNNNNNNNNKKKKNKEKKKIENRSIDSSRFSSSEATIAVTPPLLHHNDHDGLEKWDQESTEYEIFIDLDHDDDDDDHQREEKEKEKEKEEEEEEVLMSVTCMSSEFSTAHSLWIDQPTVVVDCTNTMPFFKRKRGTSNDESQDLYYGTLESVATWVEQVGSSHGEPSAAGPFEDSNDDDDEYLIDYIGRKIYFG
jgi:hypothetical protein